MEIVHEVTLNHWQTSLVAASLVIAACVSIWRNLHLGKVLKVVVAELTPNGGGSIKDKVNKGDEQNEKILADVSALTGRVEAISTDHIEIKTRLEKLEQLEYRYIDHDAKHNLPNSPLAAEAQAVLRGSRNG